MGADTTTYRIGDRLVGVRSNDPDLAASLASVLPTHLVPNVEAPPNLSFKVGMREGRVRRLHVLYRGNRPVVRTRSRTRLLRAALAHLDGFADDPPDTVRIDARLLAREGRAVLVGGGLGAIFDEAGRRAERWGYRIVDGPGVTLDAPTLAVSRRAHRLDVDRDALASFIQQEGDDHNGDPAPGILPLQAILVARPSSDGDAPSARRLVALLPLVAARDRPLDGADLDLAGRLLLECDVRTCAPEASALLAALRDLAPA